MRGVYQYITASSSSVSTCQLRNPRTISEFGGWRIKNRVAGTRISACFSFDDQPNDDVLYLSLIIGRDFEIQMLKIAFNELETRLKHGLRDRFGIVQREWISEPKFNLGFLVANTHPSR